MDTVTLDPTINPPLSYYAFAFDAPTVFTAGLPPGFSEGLTASGPKYDGKMGVQTASGAPTTNGARYTIDPQLPNGISIPNSSTYPPPLNVVLVKKRGAGYLAAPYAPVDLAALLYGATTTARPTGIIGLPAWLDGAYLPRPAFTATAASIGYTFSGTVYKPENETTQGKYIVKLTPPTSGGFDFSQAFGVYDVYDVRATYNYAAVVYQAGISSYFPPNGWTYRAASFQIVDGSGPTPPDPTPTPPDCGCTFTREQPPVCGFARDAPCQTVYTRPPCGV